MDDIEENLPLLGLDVCIQSFQVNGRTSIEPRRKKRWLIADLDDITTPVTRSNGTVLIEGLLPDGTTLRQFHYRSHPGSEDSDYPLLRDITASDIAGRPLNQPRFPVYKGINTTLSAECLLVTLTASVWTNLSSTEIVTLWGTGVDLFIHGIAFGRKANNVLEEITQLCRLDAALQALRTPPPAEATRSNYGWADTIRTTTMRTAPKHASDPDGLVLNALKLPSGHVVHANPLEATGLDLEVQAYKQTNGLGQFQTKYPPYHEFYWRLVELAHSLSPGHFDVAPTFVHVTGPGEKFWARAKPNPARKDARLRNIDFAALFFKGLQAIIGQSLVLVLSQSSWRRVRRDGDAKRGIGTWVRQIASSRLDPSGFRPFFLERPQAVLPQAPPRSSPSTGCKILFSKSLQDVLPQIPFKPLCSSRSQTCTYLSFELQVLVAIRSVCKLPLGPSRWRVASLRTDDDPNPAFVATIKQLRPRPSPLHRRTTARRSAAARRPSSRVSCGVKEGSAAEQRSRKRVLAEFDEDFGYSAENEGLQVKKSIRFCIRMLLNAEPNALKLNAAFRFKVWHVVEPNPPSTTLKWLQNMYIMSSNCSMNTCVSE
ncbi:hypothetical protein B0H13DRAFT_1889290 [Mycena leptocephala]|nr:hypothetical protein B0H13DRAFT_1889290 [Mycena leptocephala]